MNAGKATSSGAYDDANHDATVNLTDFNILAQNFGQTPRTFTQGDFNYDGRVNLSDFNILAQHFGTVLSTGRSGASSIGSGAHDDGEDDQAIT